METCCEECIRHQRALSPWTDGWMDGIRSFSMTENSLRSHTFRCIALSLCVWLQQHGHSRCCYCAARLGLLVAAALTTCQMSTCIIDVAKETKSTTTTTTNCAMTAMIDERFTDVLIAKATHSVGSRRRRC